MKKPVVIRFAKSKNVKEAFLIEALNHVCAEDVLVEGKAVLPRGSVVDSKATAFLATLGIDRVAVYEEPRVAVLVVGDGLMAPGVPPQPGKVYDSCIPVLRAALEDMHMRPVFARRLAREPKLLRRLVPFGMNQSDLMVLLIKESWADMPDVLRELENNGARVVPLSGADPDPARFSEDEKRKVVFCLPYDAELLIKYFHTHIRPAILFFMGYRGLSVV